MEAKQKPSTPSTYKGLMVLKSKGLVPRGVKFSTSGGKAIWKTKDGADYFTMPLDAYATAQAKAQGFAIA